MNSWQLNASKDLQNVELQSEQPREKSAKIRMTKSIIATSESLIYAGKNPFLEYPVIFGTSGVGIATDDCECYMEMIKKGTRVYVANYAPCGQCYNCRNDNDDFCQDPVMLGVNVNGCMANFANVPKSNIYSIPENVKDIDCLFIDDIALANNILHALNVEKGDNIIIYGANILGNILAQLALYYQLVPIVIDGDEEDLAICKKNGIYYTINTKTENLKEKLLNITSGRFSSHTAFLTNTNSNFQDALTYTKEFGDIAFAGHDCPETTVNLQTAFLKQLKIKCMSNGYRYIEKSINAIAQGIIQTKNLIDRSITFEYVSDTLFKISANVIKLPKSKKIIVDIK